MMVKDGQVHEALRKREDRAFMQKETQLLGCKIYQEAS